MTMRTFLGGLCLLVVFTQAAAAADVNGKWKADFETPDGQKAQNVFTFKVDGEKVTGTVFSSLAGNEVKIDEGQIKGDQITFAITRNFGGGDVRIRYNGKVACDEIKILAIAGDGGEGFKIEMTAKREKP